MFKYAQSTCSMIHKFNCVYIIREFIGPIIGGGLTDLLNFRATATVSEIILISCCACVIHHGKINAQIFGEALLALVSVL